MGRLLDAVLAVSVLAMASAVAWADWVISCYGVSSEAMFQILDGQIMVRSEKQGGQTKNGYIFETISLICLIFGQHLPEGVYYAVEHWQWCQGHDDVTMGANDDAASQKWENSHFLANYH